jgi:predicted RNase H-like HicB family nuclease
MAVTYKVINEETFPLFYACFSSLTAMKLQPTVDDALLFWQTRDHFFTLNYDTVLQSAASLDVETEQEDDGRWIAEIPSLPGVLAYGDSVDSAIASARQLASRVIASQPTGGVINSGPVRFAAHSHE